MSTAHAAVDKKSVMSSLSVDAAEFIPQSSAKEHTNSVPPPLTDASHLTWKGGKPLETTEMPRYLTSCYPFISPDVSIRQHVPRFPHPHPYTGGIPQSLPTWQAVKPGFVGNFQPSSFGAISYDSLPVELSSVRRDTLLLAQPKIGVSAPPPPGPGMLLTPFQDAVASWVMSMPSPIFLQQQKHQQYPQQQQSVKIATTAEYFAVPQTNTPKPTLRSNIKKDSSVPIEIERETRPHSPVLISRSTQTDIPTPIHNFTLEEKPHPLYVRRTKRDHSDMQTAGVESARHDVRTESEDSDSGYSSPMHKQNLISCGVQAFPSEIHPKRSTFTDTVSSSSTPLGNMDHSFTNCSSRSNGKSNTNNQQAVKLDSGQNSVWVDRKKQQRKKKNQTDMTRSSKLSGTSTKLLSKSSSSSPGPKPEEDDEKINLHSWTDFPPMSSRVVPSSASSKPIARSHVSPDDQMPLKIERSANEPPWSIKFSSADQLRPERSRSSSGDKDRNMTSKLMTSSETTCSKTGRSTKNRQHIKDKELLLSGHDPVVNSSGEVAAMSSSTAGCSGIITSSSVVSGSDEFSQKTKRNENRIVERGKGSQGILNNHIKFSEKNAFVRTLDSCTKHELPPSAVQSSAALFSSGSVTTTSSTYATVNSRTGYDPAQGLCKAMTHEAQLVPVHLSTLLSARMPLSHISGTDFISSASVPPMMSPKPHILQAQTVNYNIPPPKIPAPVPSIRDSSPNHMITSYANVIQGPFHRRGPGPRFVPAGKSPRMIQPVIPAYQNGSVAFIPPPHTAVPPPFSCYTVNTTQEFPLQIISGVTTCGPHPQIDLVMKPATDNALNSGRHLKSSDHQSTLVVNPQLPGDNLATHVSSASKASTIRTKPTVDISLCQQLGHEQMPHKNSDGNSNLIENQGDEKRRRRRRRRRGKTKHGHNEVNECEEVCDGTQNEESILHFEDMDEFPDLHSSTLQDQVEEMANADRLSSSGPSVTYSDILKSAWSKAGSQSQTQSLTGSYVSGDNDDEDNTSCQTGTTNESKSARKRRKRREQANKAAEAELAEISLEQQWLKAVGLKKSASPKSGEPGVTGIVSGRATPGLITESSVINEAKKQASGRGGGKKSQQPIAFDIAAMIDAIQKKPEMSAASPLKKAHSSATSSKMSKKEWERNSSSACSTSNPSGNILDSSAPTQKRGKEREMAKAKKPSPLKKVILKEREQRKRLLLLDEDPDSATGLGNVGLSSGVGIAGGESELSQDDLSNKSEDIDEGDPNGATELSADFSPISQTSPISMSPASPGNSGVNSPITGSVGRDPVVMKIHSRRFREYCTQILDKEIDQCCTSLLQDLVKFQDRMYHKDPVKAKTKRRIVLGLREVNKHLKLKKIKCVVISPNLEKIQSKGGLDEALNNILNMCREQDVPFVFALGRRALGRACGKLVPVSVVGIFNYEGCENKYRNLISFTAAARTAYNDMVLAVEKEVAEYPSIASQTSSIAGVPGLFAAHMGHSRTPSGCSAISFTSSILSEPISENFPHAEPEVDSKGYEIIHDAASNVVHTTGYKGQDHTRLVPDFDDGNEADTEDFGEIRKKKKERRVQNSVRFGDVGSINDHEESNVDLGGKDLNSDGNTVVVTSDGNDVTNDDVEDGTSIGKLSRNVSELTLTNEDNFILKGEPYAVKLKCSFRDFEDDNEEFNDEEVDDEEFNDEDEGCEAGSVSDPECSQNAFNEYENTSGKKWTTMGHIDSIHSESYNLGDEILSHHSPQQHDMRARNHSATSQPSPSASYLSVSCDNGGHCRSQEADYDCKNDIVDKLDEIEKDQLEEEGASKSLHRVIDKERIKNWLESQSNMTTED